MIFKLAMFGRRWQTRHAIVGVIAYVVVLAAIVMIGALFLLGFTLVLDGLKEFGFAGYAVTAAILLFMFQMVLRGGGSWGLFDRDGKIVSLDLTSSAFYQRR